VAVRVIDFEAAFAAVEDVKGWLTEAQALMLWQAAQDLDAPARVVEIGSYQGRSAIVLARALATRGLVVAIDPHAGNDRGPQEEETTAAGQSDYECFQANLASAGVDDGVFHVRLASQEALAAVEGAVDLLYVDGAHGYRDARADIRAWGARVRPGGTLLIHDAFSSVGVTRALLRELVLSGDFRYGGRAGSLARYRRQRVRGRERVVSCARQLAQLGWFGRNLLVKVALVATLRPLARALGQRDLSWPY
jgi:predicted O-methyltransferase YrrM